MVFKKNILCIVLGGALLITQAGAQENTSKKSIVLKLQKTGKTSGAEKCALACGYATSLAIIYSFIEQPRGLWDFFCKAAGVSITVGFTGNFIAGLYRPIFDSLEHVFIGENKKDIPMNVVIQWDNIKLPEPLRDKFDQFCKKYEKNGSIEITEEQAVVFAKEIIQEINRVYESANPLSTSPSPAE